jgi:hypothetical protein
LKIYLGEIVKILTWLASLIGISLASNALADAPVLPKSEHAIIIHFTYGSTDLSRLFTLEDQLEHAITQAGTGELDGHEIAVDGSDGYLYMYGPDADRLFETIKPILKSTSFMLGAEVTKRYGPPNAESKESFVVIEL